MSEAKTCSACAKPIEVGSDGIELWGSLFCSMCFIANSAKMNKEFTAADIAILRQMGKELAGLLPGQLLEMILVAFHKRSNGNDRAPDELELARAVGEIQRLTAFSVFRQTLNLLKTWQDMFNEFVQTQEAEIQSKVKRLTDLE